MALTYREETCSQYLGITVKPKFVQVDHDDKDNKSLLAFNELWESKFRKDCLLVFSTGRSLKLYNELRVCSLPSQVFAR